METLEEAISSFLHVSYVATWSVWDYGHLMYLQRMVAKIDQNEAKLLNLGKILQTRRTKRAKLLRRHLMHLPAAHLC
jgi:hypothetical protein